MNKGILKSKRMIGMIITLAAGAWDWRYICLYLLHKVRKYILIFPI